MAYLVPTAELGPANRVHGLVPAVRRTHSRVRAVIVLWKPEGLAWRGLAHVAMRLGRAEKTEAEKEREEDLGRAHRAVHKVRQLPPNFALSF